MKKLVIQDHTRTCSQNHVLSRCEPLNFIFQYNWDFYLITYPECLESRGTHLDLKQSFLNKVGLLLKSDTRVERGWEMRVIRKEMSIDELLNKPKKEILYLYASSKEYCMYRQTKFTQFLIASDEYLDNANRAMNEIQSDIFLNYTEKEILTKQIENLILSNVSDVHFEHSDRERISLTDLLTKKILQTK